MTDCFICKFETLKVPDLITNRGEIYHATVLKSKERSHSCVFSPKRIPENVRYSLNDLPAVQFLKVDNLLRRRFYAICPPIQRKRLWNCSRTCANLGRKPTTLIVRSFFAEHVRESSPTVMDSFHVIPSMNSIVLTGTNQVLLDNFVMDFRLYFSCYGFYFSEGIAELTKFVEFNQTRVGFKNDHNLPRFYPLIFTPKVTSLELYDNPGDLSQIWPLLPNLESVSAYSCVLRFSSLEIVHCPKIWKIVLFPDWHLNYSMIAQFLRNRRANLWLTLHCTRNLVLNRERLLQHFVPVKKHLWHRKGLCFFNTKKEFFMLR